MSERTALWFFPVSIGVQRSVQICWSGVMYCQSETEIMPRILGNQSKKVSM